MLLQRMYQDGLAQAAYLAGCQATGEALIVDPNRHIAHYREAAARAGMRIVAVTETHIHADFVSGACELAAATGARLYLSGAGPDEWKYAYAAGDGATLLHDGDSFMVGNIRVDVRHTPGHTPEHLAFMITDTAGADAPMGLLTGDFVFVGDVGRPDLLESAAGLTGTAAPGARRLYASLQGFRALPDYLQIWPGHGAGSACGTSLGAVPQSTVGYEKRFNWAFQAADEAEFVATVLAGQPEPPPYFAQMKRINKAGPAPVPTATLPVGTAASLAAALAAGMPVVDVRSADIYAAGHVPGTINIAAGGDFLTWAGWLLPYDRPLGLIGDPASVAAARAELALIGLDAVAETWTPAVVAAGPGATFARRRAMEIGGVGALRDLVVLDVRRPDEYAAGHVPGSLNIPLGHLAARLDEVPAGRPVLVHCAGGVRSPIAASLLTGHGWASVVDMRDGFGGWRAAGLPVER
jgi:hydroxyacylglutathione hydrolase